MKNQNWMRRVSPLEIFLISDYLGSLLSAIFILTFLAILLLSLLVELIERSKVPRWYYWFMFVSVLAPLLVSALFLLLGWGNLSWLNSF